MDHPQNSRPFQVIKDWNWQSQRLLKEHFGQLTLADVKFEVGKENELLYRLGIRLNKTHQEIERILRKLKLAH